MVDKFLRVLAALGFGVFSFVLPASAQDTTRIRGMVERIEGPIFVVKTRDGSEVKLTVTDSPLFVVIVPGKMSDIKPGMFVGSAGMMQEDGSQKAIEVHIFPESMRGTGEGHYDWDLLPKSKMTNGNVEHAVTGVDGAVGQIQRRREKACRDAANGGGDVRNGEAGRNPARHQDFCRRRQEAGRRHFSDAEDYVWQKRRGPGFLKQL